MSKNREDDDTAVQRRILRSLWEPHPGQRAIMAHPARFRVVACGRRWGKSEMCAHLALEHALEHPGSTVWWVAPTYDQANEFGFEKVKPLLSPAVLADDPKRTKPRKFVLTNDSTVSFRSAEREDSLRGGGVDFLVIDESGSVPERAWTDELRPALSDTEGDAVFVGTPKGRNWFHQWFQRGQSADRSGVASWQAPTIQNPHVPDEEVEAAREDMPERVFEQEYRAQFVDDTGGVFRNVRERVEGYDLPVAPADCEAPFAIGVDLARLQNWTVAVVLDDRGKVVAFERLQQTTWSRIQRTIEQLAGRYDPATVALDASRDNKIVQDLAAAGLATEPVRFTPTKKRTLVENLATALEVDELTLSADATPLANELEVYEYEATDSGRVKYGSPPGFHDDCVDALALAEWARTNVDTGPIQVPSTW